MDFKQWEGFDKSGKWIDEINVRNFIQKNYLSVLLWYQFVLIDYKSNSFFLSFSAL